MPDVDCDQAVIVLERVRASLAAAARHGGHAPFTASFGVTDSTKGESLQELIQLADIGLYMAKAAGRDRISIADGLNPVATEPPANGNGRTRKPKPAIVEAAAYDDHHPEQL
jgi:hypothetical protein